MQVGKYHRIAELARGGMGIVYVAVTRGPGGFSKVFVLKEVRHELVSQPEFLAMFLEEARLAARLSHPNIVQTYEVGIDGPHHFLVMDYLDGTVLSRILRKRDERFTVAQQLRVLAEVLYGLQYAHTAASYDGSPAGVVHRDVTPQNIFLTVDGQVKLMDFGIAKSVDSQVETRVGTLKGKPSYMAPEQVRGNADNRSDLFSIGVMLWESVAGRRMWGQRSEVETLTALLAANIPKLAEAAPAAHPRLVEIANRALAPDPALRFQSAQEFSSALDDYLANEQADKASLKQAGLLVAELFQAERSRAQSAIESSLKHLAAGEAPSQLPRLGVGDLRTPSGPSVSSGGFANSTRTMATPPFVATPKAFPPATRRWPLFGLIAAATILLVGGALVALALRGKRGDAGEAGKSASSSTVPPAQPLRAAPSDVAMPAPTQETVQVVSFSVSPSSAQLWVDGRGARHGEEKKCAPGAQLHVRAVAPGYEPVERDVECKTGQFTLAMAPIRGGQPQHFQPVRPPLAGPSSAPPPAETRSPEATPLGTGKVPFRPVDPNNPYGTN